MSFSPTIGRILDDFPGFEVQCARYLSALALDAQIGPFSGITTTTASGCVVVRGSASVAEKESKACVLAGSGVGFERADALGAGVWGEVVD